MLAFAKKHLMDYGLLFRYIVSGGSAAATQIILLYILTEWFGLWYVVSAVFAFIVAVAISFTLQKYWAFNNRETGKINRQFAIYISVQITSLTLNTAAIYALVEYLGFWYILAQILMGVVITIINFLVYKFVIFSNGNSPAENS